MNSQVAVVISNNGDSLALQRAEKEGIPHFYLSAKNMEGEENLARRLLEVLEEFSVDMIVLAGYLRLLHPSILERYEGRIFNIHPALLPKYGGKGMYGKNVHAAVIAAGESQSGVTIHRVSADYDAGEIVAQTTVPVLEGDSVETLAARVLEREHTFLVEVIARIEIGEIPLGT